MASMSSKSSSSSFRCRYGLSTTGEHVPGGEVEREGRQLGREIGEPGEVIRRGGLQQEHYDPGEVDVRDHHDVELAEEDELVHVAHLLSVRHGSLAEVLDGPHDGEEDSAAADDVEEVEEVAPLQPPASAGPSASTMSAAMLANTCRGITMISTCFSRSLRNGLRKPSPCR